MTHDVRTPKTFPIQEINLDMQSFSCGLFGLFIGPIHCTENEIFPSRILVVDLSKQIWNFLWICKEILNLKIFLCAVFITKIKLTLLSCFCFPVLFPSNGSNILQVICRTAILKIFLFFSKVASIKLAALATLLKNESIRVFLRI